MDEFKHDPVLHPGTRHPDLPRFIKYLAHPLWRHGPAFVYKWDVTPSLQAPFFKKMHDRIVEGRFEHELERDGKMRLLPYEAVFARHKGKF